MVAFYLGLILGALGGFLILSLLSMVVRKDKPAEAPDRVAGYGELLSNRAGCLPGVANNL